MSLFLDHKYVNLVSPRLEKFKRKNQKSYNFRCPLCGDSQKSKIKARGYFFVRGNKIGFYCHNCLESMSLGDFLKKFDSGLYEQYIFEIYGKNETIEKPSFDEFNFKTTFQNKKPDDLFVGYDTVAALPNSHFAQQYIDQRKIPRQFWKDIFFIPDFKELVDKVEPDNEYTLKVGDPRIVFPFRDGEKRIIAFQGRSFKDRGLRYITIKVVKDGPKIFGLDRVSSKDRVYVVEGPIDSLFLPNSIATAGSNLGSDDIPNFDDLVFIFDNERRSKAIVKNMEKIAKQGKKLFVWPSHIQEKDINKLILVGKTSEEIVWMINTNTYQGLSTVIKINEWKRC